MSSSVTVAVVTVFKWYLGMGSFPSKVANALKISYRLFFKSARILEVHENQEFGDAWEADTQKSKLHKNFMNQAIFLLSNNGSPLFSCHFKYL